MTHPDGPLTNAPNARSFAVEVFFDGDCPLCTREIAMLRWLDRRQRIRFTDIATPTFDAAALCKTQRQLMDRIHGRLADGCRIEGVEVFRRLYGAVGFEVLIPLTRLPGVRHALDWGYERFARNRLRWTRRCAPDGACRLDHPVTRARPASA
ncbi:MAG TPA: DUF393 domain-containing protein [Burkholderiaceae bacterium]|nr:DUF393 domain-containing protein [Burkholderiaceae bacterium]